MKIKKVIVVGGGPAGMMAAVRSAQLGAAVTLIEKNASLGRKLLLTGKGRCNLTNACGVTDFIKRFGKNGAFLRDAFKVFFNAELMNFFESRGLKVKVERQERVFPASDRASTVLTVLNEELEKHGVSILYRRELEHLQAEAGKVTGVVLADGEIVTGDALVLATGGLSYAFTGSDGTGLKAAAEIGHRIVDCRPGLVALRTEEKFVRDLMGLTLKNIRLFFTDGKRKIITDIGEMLFTDFGISGPLVLTHSSTVVDWLADGKRVIAEIDLKPALSVQQLDARFIKEFHDQPKRSIKNLLKDFLPASLIEVFLKIAKVSPEKMANQVRQDERAEMAELLKGFPLHVIATLPIEEAMVTKGGVALKEIDPRTMASKIIKGLYFAGEMIDVDGDTGGFNLQAAFSTGYLAGENAGR